MKINYRFHFKSAPSYIFIFSVLLLAIFSLVIIFTSVNAQGNLPPGVTPQKVRAVLIKTDQTRTDTGELISSEETYVEFWNVGELGGDAYKTATVFLTIYYRREGTSTVTYDLIFSGGPDPHPVLGCPLQCHYPFPYQGCHTAGQHLIQRLFIFHPKICQGMIIDCYPAQ